MQRSESILVWAVSAIVVVIVLVAVVFGRNDELGTGPQAVDPKLASMVPGGQTPAVKAGVSDDVLNLLRDPGVSVPGDQPDPAGGAGAAPVDANGVADANAADAALRERIPELRTLLGEFRLEGQVGGERYRVVTVRSGDTFGTLVQRWAGSLARGDEVRALNESLVPERLRSGDEIWFPWVEDVDLIEAAKARGEGVARAAVAKENAPVNPPAVPSGGAPFAVVPADAGASPSAPLASGSAPAAKPESGDWRTVKSGESLWRIASDAVGPRRAQEYIDQILKLNPTLRDPGQVRAGDRLLLPKR
ncbi:MAG: LysM peptidoglycan-binding domain-containing protein [Planctomycetes bacterium]|nr:LysM peptidoglycan-binding domain-containing protein [Planctomycetota bacterium]